MPKHTHLVCQHLERVSSKLLAEFQHEIRSYVRGRQGVYALYKGEKLHYVGLASDLRVRLRQHLSDRHGERWDCFSIYLTNGAGYLRELEALLLRIVQPRGNRQVGRLAGSENLLRRIRKQMVSRNRLRVETLLGQAASPVRGGREKRDRSRTRVRGTGLQELVDRPIPLRAQYKGKAYSATLRPDGLQYGGKFFATPSGAAKAIMKRPCTGWTFWRYERTPGDWVRLEELRRGRRY